MNRLNFISMGGEMGRLIREKDWSQTCLGDPRHWPQSLKTTLSIILNSKFPKFVFWGEDLICFYNDAYRPTLGDQGKHPAILGEKAENAWAEIWHIIKPMMDQVLETGEATWSQNQLIPFYRDGEIKDMYFTFSYSPIVDETGKVAGIFTSVMETTSDVVSRTELELANKRYHEHIMQAPVAMAVLEGKDHVVDIANEMMLQIWGKESDQILGRPIFDALPGARGQGLEAIMNDVFHTGEKFEANERLIKLPRNGREETLYVNFVYEPVKDLHNQTKSIVVIASDVTAQVVARQKIEESEYRFRNVADSAPVLIWMSGTDKLCYFFNQAWLGFTGRTLDQEAGNGWVEGVHPDDLERCVAIYTASFDARREFYMEYRLKRNDGAYRWISDKGVPRFTPNGVFEGFIGACMDIDETVTYSKVLKENKEKLSIVIDASKLAVWEYDLRKKSGHFSNQYAQMFGYTDENELAKEDIAKHLHPDDKQLRDEAEKEMLDTGFLNYESRIVWNDGTVRWIDVNGKLFYDDENAPLKMMGTIRDITDEKRHEQDLKEREEKFRLLADEMPQFVWTADTDGSLNYFNKSVYRYSGLTKEILEDGNWLVIVHPDDREENIRLWTQAVNSGNDFVFEHRFKRHDGVYRWQLSRAKAQLDDKGNITMWVGTSTDIHDIKEIDEQKDYFISMASHELKTPITSIKGYIQLLESKYKSSNDDFLKSSLKVVHKQIESLTNLVADLLDVSRIKTGGLQLRRSDFNLNELIKEVVTEIQHINPQNKINFDENATIHVNADEETIRQVLINFLTNAVKYSPDSLDVFIELKMFENEVYVGVTDGGIGISEENQARIFDRFYRVEGKNEKKFPGFGIGLFIAAEILRKHQGEIGVRSKIGEGSTFYFTLPVE